MKHTPCIQSKFKTTEQPLLIMKRDPISRAARGPETRYSSLYNNKTTNGKPLSRLQALGEWPYRTTSPITPGVYWRLTVETDVKNTSTVLALASLGILSASVFAGIANAAPSTRGFVCGSSSGVPSTNAVKADGKQVPVIKWTSNVFDSAGWSPQRRCQEVSARFDQYLKEGRLNYLTTGRLNGVPVICTAQSRGGACDGLLYTLKPGQNATATLQNLLEIRVKARGPLNETSSRLYVSLDELLNTAQANAAGGANVQEHPPSSRGTALW